MCGVHVCGTREWMTDSPRSPHHFLFIQQEQRQRRVLLVPNLKDEGTTRRRSRCHLSSLVCGTRKRTRPNLNNNKETGYDSQRGGSMSRLMPSSWMSKRMPSSSHWRRRRHLISSPVPPLINQQDGDGEIPTEEEATKTQDEWYVADKCGLGGGGMKNDCDNDKPLPMMNEAGLQPNTESPIFHVITLAFFVRMVGQKCVCIVAVVFVPELWMPLTTQGLRAALPFLHNQSRQPFDVWSKHDFWLSRDESDCDFVTAFELWFLLL